MELARVCAGYTPGQSDRLRQAMTHKRSDEEMAKLRAETYAGMASRGITGEAADEIWEKLQGFASFGFPESHSVSFAYIVYMSSWLRAHWPTEYLAGLLNAQPMGFYSPNSLVADAGRPRGGGAPPDVNESSFDCAVVPLAADAEDLVAVAGLSWRRGRGLLDDPVHATTVRLGLRYVRELGEVEITRIEAPAWSVSLHRGSGPGAAHRPDSGGPGGPGRRRGAGEPGGGAPGGMWAAGALAGMGPGRLALAEGAEAPPLALMTPVEEARPISGPPGSRCATRRSSSGSGWPGGGA